MQRNEKKNSSYGAKRTTAIIISIIWLILGAVILEWLPLVPAHDSSVPDNNVTIDATSFFLQQRGGEGGNLHLYEGENEYILPTGQYIFYDNLVQGLGDKVDLTGKYYVDTNNAYLRTPVVTGFGTYTEDFINSLFGMVAQMTGITLPQFKWPAEFKKTLNYIPLMLDNKLAPCKTRLAWTFSSLNTEFYTVSISGKPCTVVVYENGDNGFYWVFEGITVQEIRYFGLQTTILEQRSSEVNVLSSDRVFCQTLEDEELIPVADAAEATENGVIPGKTLASNRLSLARSFGMLDPMSIIIAFIYILPLILFLRNILNNHALHLEDTYESKGLTVVQKECNKLHTLKTVFTIIGAIWVGGYVVVMLINMFAIEEPMRALFKDPIVVEKTNLVVQGLTANQSILGIFTGLFFHIPATFTDMTGYVEMLLSISSLAINACFGLFPALIFGAMAKEADSSYERFKLHSSHK